MCITPVAQLRIYIGVKSDWMHNKCGYQADDWIHLQTITLQLVRRRFILGIQLPTSWSAVRLAINKCYRNILQKKWFYKAFQLICVKFCQASARDLKISKISHQQSVSHHSIKPQSSALSTSFSGMFAGSIHQCNHDICVHEPVVPFTCHILIYQRMITYCLPFRTSR